MRKTRCIKCKLIYDFKKLETCLKLKCDICNINYYKFDQSKHQSTDGHRQNVGVKVRKTIVIKILVKLMLKH